MNRRGDKRETNKNKYCKGKTDLNRGVLEQEEDDEEEKKTSFDFVNKYSNIYSNDFLLFPT